MITLESMNHDKEVDANKAGINLLNLAAAALYDALLGNLLGSLYHVDEFHVVVDGVAFLEDNGPQCNVSLVQTASCDL